MNDAEARLEALRFATLTATGEPAVRAAEVYFNFLTNRQQATPQPAQPGLWVWCGQQPPK
jgi:hypothetical protein